MNKQTIGTVRGIAAIFWLGFFMAISFMEAPLKFTAPNLSLAEGLQIGRIVFGALNKCEWLFLAIILITSIFKAPTKRLTYLIGTIVIILALETAWLLPSLDAAANKIINGAPSVFSIQHSLYIFFEVVKIPVLLFIGWESLRTTLLQPQM